MLDNILNLKGVAVLNKKQQLSIEGGSGTCAYYDGSTNEVYYNLSSSEAQNYLSNASDHWCCASCNSASWFGLPGIE